MGTEHEVNIVLSLELSGFVGGTDTAGEGDLFYPALAFKAVQFSEVAAHAVDGVLAHVARVEDHEVGVFVGPHLSVASVQDHAPHPVRIVNVHLAAERPYARSLGRASRAGPRTGPRTGLRAGPRPGLRMTSRNRCVGAGRFFDERDRYDVVPCG